MQLYSKRASTMKMILPASLIILVGILISLSTLCSAGNWGTIMHARSNANIREERSVESRIVGRLMENQSVRADFLRDGWYAVFPVEAKGRDERKAIGYVYETRLFNPAEGIGKDRGYIPASDARKTGPSDRISAIEVRRISFKLKENGMDTIFLGLNRFYIPKVSSIEGEIPRVVLDFENISSFNVKMPVIRVEGYHIRQIRSSIDRRAKNARIVLDLEPLRDYFVKPEFAEKENIYMLKIFAEDKRLNSR
jgi:hypothetical protein